jgi:WD40 repeat protein
VCYVNNSVVLATAGAGGKNAPCVCVWDTLLPPAQARVAACAPHAEGGTCVAFAPGERALVSGGAGGDLAIFDLRQRKVRHQWSAHTLAVRCLSVDDGRFHAFSASADGDVKLWDLSQSDAGLGHWRRVHEPHTVTPLFQPPGTALGRTYGVTCLVDDGSRLVTGGADGRLACFCY